MTLSMNDLNKLLPKDYLSTYRATKDFINEIKEKQQSGTLNQNNNSNSGNGDLNASQQAAFQNMSMMMQSMMGQLGMWASIMQTLQASGADLSGLDEEQQAFLEAFNNMLNSNSNGGENYDFLGDSSASESRRAAFRRILAYNTQSVQNSYTGEEKPIEPIVEGSGEEEEY